MYTHTTILLYHKNSYFNKKKHILCLFYAFFLCLNLDSNIVALKIWFSNEEYDISKSRTIPFLKKTDDFFSFLIYFSILFNEIHEQLSNLGELVGKNIISLLSSTIIGVL